MQMEIDYPIYRKITNKAAHQPTLFGGMVDEGAKSLMVRTRAKISIGTVESNFWVTTLCTLTTRFILVKPGKRFAAILQL